MANLSYAQLEGAWIAAGGDKTLAPLMAAIAEAESGGNPQATNPNDNGGTQTSWGLWQISNGDHSQPAADWADPIGNARLAVAKYKSQGLGAWGTYTSGAYRQFLSNSTTPDPNVPGAAAGGSADATLTSASDDTCAASWPKVAFFGGGCIIHKKAQRHVAGGVLLGLGVIVGMLPGALVLVTFAMRSTPAGQAAGRTAGGLAELAGGAFSLAGMPEVGAPLAGAGHAVRRQSGAGQTRAGAFAQRRRAERRAPTEEQQITAQEQTRARQAQIRQRARTQAQQQYPRQQQGQQARPRQRRTGP